MTFVAHEAILPPRLFWRRFFAFSIDAVVANILVSLVLIAVAMTTGIDLGTPSLASSTQCNLAEPAMPAVQQVEALWPLAPGEARTNSICKISILGANSYLFFRSSVSTANKGSVVTTTSNRWVAFPIDESGNPLPIKTKLDFLMPLFILVFVFFAAEGRRSPGKMLLSLRMSRVDDTALDWATAFKREVLKFLPLVLTFLSQIWILLTKAEAFSSVAAMVGQVRDGAGQWFVVPVAIGIFSLIWWLGPFVVWRGQTWYDRLAGTRVLRK